MIFHEVLGFNPAGAAAIVAGAASALGAAPSNDRVRFTLGVHAPYSSSPALFRAVRAWLDERPSRVTTLHLAESPEELRFLRDGSGPWRELLDAFRAWSPAWTPPGCGPVGKSHASGSWTRGW
jgi:cytosine/adenosine deaminase-related metal-dependent hydrolase